MFHSEHRKAILVSSHLALNREEKHQ